MYPFFHESEFALSLAGVHRVEVGGDIRGVRVQQTEHGLVVAGVLQVPYVMHVELLPEQGVA